MTDCPYVATASILALCAALAAPSSALAQTAAPAVGALPDWCKIDDPAGWAKARQDLIATGVDELPEIPCPEKQTGASIPLVLYLPMPCARSMVFQRVDVPVAHALDQVQGNFGRSVDISAEKPQVVLSNGAWNAPVSGAFSITQTGENGRTGSLDQLSARAYYMARYETTVVQWAAYEMGLFALPHVETATADSPACAEFDQMLGALNLRGIPAKGDVSWFDAVNYSRAYSTWLIRRDRDRLEAETGPVLPDLPWEQGSTGYVRLPTEAEWEYAARGGASYVTSQARSARLPAIVDPADDSIRQPKLAEVCSEKPRTQGVFVGPVGRKAPNVLGLYDVVCNADEIVLDLFRPTRPDGLSGQVGGVLTKGGASAFLRDANTIGRRTEAAALFGLDGEGQTPAMGFRLAVAAPVFVGRRDDGAAQGYAEGRLNEPFDAKLMAGRVALLENGVGLSDPDKSADLTAEVNKLRRSLSEGELTQQQLNEQAERLQIELERLDARLSEEARAATLLTIRTGIVTANLIDRMGRNVYAALLRIDTAQSQGNLSSADRDRIARLTALLRENEQRIQASFDLYLQVHSELGARDTGFVSRQLAASRTGLGGVSVDVFGGYLDLFEGHFREVASTRGQITERQRLAWLEQLDATRADRHERFPRLQPK